MCDRLFQLNPTQDGNLQKQIREVIVNAILDGHIPHGGTIPSCRQLAKQLSVSRNTVVLTYEKLVDEGFLYSKERSGYFVSNDFQPATIRNETRAAREIDPPLDWNRRLRLQPSRDSKIIEPRNWQEYAYPYVYGQPDKSLFPFQEWRECARDANSPRAIQSWLTDRVDADNTRLLEQLHTRILPERGVWVNPDEILATLGRQHSLYLLSQLLTGSGTTVGIEDPGYVDARHIFEATGAQVVPLPLDDEGLIVDERIAACDVVYVTPSHQSPSTITMSDERRRRLLAAARRHDFVVIEDDYEGETNLLGQQIPALKSLDKDDRIIYVGNLSQALAPGLRLGYLVCSASLIREARALLHFMTPHSSGNNQLAAALFLARGYHETLLHRLNRTYRERWQTMHDALQIHLPGMAFTQTCGGTSFWIQAPPQIDTRQLAQDAAEKNVFIEPGHVHFAASTPPRNYFRLGFAAIPNERIEPGIARLAYVIKESTTAPEAACPM